MNNEVTAEYTQTIRTARQLMADASRLIEQTAVAQNEDVAADLNDIAIALDSLRNKLFSLQAA